MVVSSMGDVYRPSFSLGNNALDEVELGKMLVVRAMKRKGSDSMTSLNGC